MLKQLNNLEPKTIASFISQQKLRTVRIHGRRTSVRLESHIWQALYEVARIENVSVQDLINAIHDSKSKGTSFSSSLRVFLVTYFRNAAEKKFSPAIVMLGQRPKMQPEYMVQAIKKRYEKLSQEEKLCKKPSNVA